MLATLSFETNVLHTSMIAQTFWFVNTFVRDSFQQYSRRIIASMFSIPQDMVGVKHNMPVKCPFTQNSPQKGLFFGGLCAIINRERLRS
jgi:hypothetical protein